MITYYPFELHTHTIHSDGQFTPEELINRAKEQGYKGLAITDHNTTSAHQEMLAYGENTSVCVIPGIEWTTFYGHITVLGGKSNINYIEINQETINEKITLARQSGDAVGVAHPYRIGYPVCTGGRADFHNLDINLCTHFEVWSQINPYKDPASTLALEEYIKHLNKGAKLACVYGRDWHGKTREGNFDPVTYIGMDKGVSSHNAVQAIIEGRTYISLGLYANIELVSETSERFALGSEVPEGKYVLSISLAHNNIKRNFDQLNIKEIEILGTATKDVDRITKVGFGGFAKRLVLNKGYFLVKVNGVIDNEEMPLLISSPFYIR